MHASDSQNSPVFENQAELFGHPTGLFTLFFAEMWERFSYYGMRALLLLYMVKGFLKYTDGDAYAVYGSYTSLVYMTPFFGGLIADKLLGQRWAVILGGIMMAIGHLVMVFENEVLFFVALSFLIVGNGFFKPNISTIVGSLYPPGDNRRDGGFTIFYIGINLGAALAPLLCGYLGEVYGWHFGFGAATIGMMIGLAVFWAPTRLAQALILVGALLCAGGMIYTQADKPLVMLIIYLGMALALVGSAVCAFLALGRGGLPEKAGAPPFPEKLREVRFGMPAGLAVVVGSLLAVPVLTLLVGSSRTFSIIPKDTLKSMAEGGGFLATMSIILKEVSTPAGLLLTIAGVVALVHILRNMKDLKTVAKERMYVVLVMMFFSLLFWAFFEQAGSSISNFTDRNIDRVTATRTVEQKEVGQAIRFRIPQSSDGIEGLPEDFDSLPILSQAQLGQAYGDPASSARVANLIKTMEEESATKDGKEIDEKKRKEIDDYVAKVAELDGLTMTGLAALRERAADKEKRKEEDYYFSWTVVPANVGMGIAENEMQTSIFQAANPTFILLFGLVFTVLWAFLAKRRMEPNTPVKFALGLLQLGLGFAALWYGAANPDARGMVSVSWLILAYLLHTTGELCLSPVGLSMVTKLSPKVLVSTVMGAWFLATAFSNFVAAIIAQFTGIGHGDEGKSVIPAPVDTVDVYGHVFGLVALMGIISALICFALAPKLKTWMHEGEPTE